MLTNVTLSGADDGVDPSELAALSAEFPFVEWGILQSQTRAGTPRYPSPQWCRVLAATKARSKAAMLLSAHLCGSLARLLLDGDSRALRGHFAASHDTFERVQVNGYRTGAKASFLRTCKEATYLEIILQVPAEDSLQQAGSDATQIGHASLLFDPSGGRGFEPFKWPRAPVGVRIGYAGGIGPDNVLEVVPRIYEDTAFLGDPFWIDMESGVRDEQDRFDLGRVRRVLEQTAPLIGHRPRLIEHLGKDG